MIFGGKKHGKIVAVKVLQKVGGERGEITRPVRICL